MDALLDQLDAKLREWPAATADDVRARVREIMEWADQGFLDLARSRQAEQDVLDLLDELDLHDAPPSR